MSFEPIFKLKDWIPENQLCPMILNMNPKAFRYIMNRPETMHPQWIYKNTNPLILQYIQNQHSINKPENIRWEYIVQNESAVPYLKTQINNPNFTNFMWKRLNMNTEGVQLLQDYHPELMKWELLSSNPGAMHLLETNPDRIHWDYFSRNPHPKAILMLEQNIDKIYIDELVRNTNALHLIRKLFHLVKPIHYVDLTINHCTVPLLEEHPHIIAWEFLVLNHNAIELLERNQHKIEPGMYTHLSSNPGCFILDKTEMMKQIRHFAEELVSIVFHPRRVSAYMEQYKYNILEDEYWTDI